MKSVKIPDPRPLPSALYLAATVEAANWLGSKECTALIANMPAGGHEQRAAHVFLADRIPGQGSWQEIAERFVRGYLDSGTSSGYNLRNDPVSQILLREMADQDGVGTEHIAPAVTKLKQSHKDVYEFMLTLAVKHATICQAVLRDAFKADALILRRGVNMTNKNWPIESWVYHGSTATYGDTPLIARVPLNSVVSLRGQEHELVIARHASSALHCPGVRRVWVSTPVTQFILRHFRTSSTWAPESLLD